MSDQKQIVHTAKMLYGTDASDPSALGAANSYLMKFQSSVQAWTISHQILSEQKQHSLPVLTFAAMTLRTKIIRDFQELPSEMHASFKDSLMANLKQAAEYEEWHSSQEAHTFMIQMSLIIVDLALYMVSWTNSIKDVIDQLYPNSTHVGVLMEILKVLPEEARNKNIRLSAKRRHVVLKQLRVLSDDVLEFLQHSLKRTDLPDSLAIHGGLRICGSWAKAKLLKLSNLIHHPIIHKANEVLLHNRANESVLHDLSTECMLGILHCIEHRPTILRQREFRSDRHIFDMISSLEKPFHLSSVDTTANYAHLITSLCDAFFDLAVFQAKKVIVMVDQNELLMGQRCFELLVQLSERCELSIAQTSLSVWSFLGANLLSLGEPEVNLLYQPYIHRLVRAMLRHSRLSMDHGGLIPPESDMAHFRGMLSETLTDVSHLVHKEEVENLARVIRNPESLWLDVEVAIFFMSHMVEERPEFMTSMLEPMMSHTHPAVRYQAIQLLSRCHSWLGQNPKVMLTLLNYLFDLLRQRSLLSNCAGRTLACLCDKLCAELLPHAEDLLSLSGCLDEFQLEESVELDLLKAICKVLKQFSSSHLVEVMQRLLNSQWQALSNFLKDPNQAEWDGELPARCLMRAATIINQLKPNDSSELELSQHIVHSWPLIVLALKRCGQDELLPQSLVKLLLAILPSETKPLPLAEEMLWTFCQLYLQERQPIYFRLSGLVLPHLLPESRVQKCCQVLECFLVPSFQALQEDNGFALHEDILLNCFSFAASFFASFPLVIMDSIHFNSLLDCALASISPENCESDRRAVLKFFESLLGCWKVDVACLERLRILLQSYGSVLLSHLFDLAIFKPHDNNKLLYLVAGVLAQLHHILPSVPLQCLVMPVLNALPEVPESGEDGIEGITYIFPEIMQLCNAICYTGNLRQMVKAFVKLTQTYNGNKKL